MKNFFTILGGMGTMATESFIHVLNERTPHVHCDQDYFNYLMVNHARVPDRTAFILDHAKEDPGPVLREDVKQYAPLGPDFFVVACNTAHYFYEEMQQLTDIPILHMPRLAVEAALDRFAGTQEKIRVGLLATEGTIATQIYSQELEKHQQIEVILPDKQLQQQITDLIYRDVKENNFINEDLYEHILQQMTDDYGCDVLILGCTELSLVQEENKKDQYPVIDAQSVLIDETIKRALNMRKEAGK